MIGDFIDSLPAWAIYALIYGPVAVYLAALLWRANREARQLADELSSDDTVARYRFPLDARSREDREVEELDRIWEAS
jgi:hypothetical protein